MHRILIGITLSCNRGLEHLILLKALRRNQNKFHFELSVSLFSWSGNWIGKKDAWEVTKYIILLGLTILGAGRRLGTVLLLTWEDEGLYENFPFTLFYQYSFSFHGNKNWKASERVSSSWHSLAAYSQGLVGSVNYQFKEDLTFCILPIFFKLCSFPHIINKNRNRK